MDSTDVLVTGGGISGITAAVELAETGVSVVLIEKQPFLGGRVLSFNQYFPKLCPPWCGLEINFQRIRRNPLIRVFTETELEDLNGEEGNYTAALIRKPQYVSEHCTACGECQAVCPVEGPDAFNYGLNTRNAITLPVELSQPFKYHLDEKICLFDACKKCLEACRYDAIDLEARPVRMELSAAAVIDATGWMPYEKRRLKEYHPDDSADVLSNVEMERLSAPGGPTKGKILRPSDGQQVKKLAFIQCAGSRDTGHLPYCSAVCCSASLKQALYATEEDPELEASIYYIDLRVSGRNEDFLRKTEAHERIFLVKGKVAELEPGRENGRIGLRCEDIVMGRLVEEEFDLVVLATGMVHGSESSGYHEPDTGVVSVSSQLISGNGQGVTENGQGVTENGQGVTENGQGVMKNGQGGAENAQRVAENGQVTAGNVQVPAGNVQVPAGNVQVIRAGCAAGPMDVSASLKDATGAALKALQIVNKHSLKGHGG